MLLNSVENQEKMMIILRALTAIVTMVKTKGWRETGWGVFGEGGGESNRKGNNL